MPARSAGPTSTSTGAFLHLPRPKGGTERAFTLPLSSVLVDLLQQRKAGNAQLAAEGAVPEGEVWAFPAYSESGHVEEPREAIAGVPFTRARSAPGGVSATIAESLDISAYALQALLNHRQPRGSVTAGYVNIDVERLRAPMQAITDRLLAIGAGRAGRRWCRCGGGGR